MPGGGRCRRAHSYASWRACGEHCREGTVPSLRVSGIFSSAGLRLTRPAQNHNFTFDEEIKVSSVTQAVCDLALRFGESTEDDEAMMVSAGGG
jgi:hypothetical protein